MTGAGAPAAIVVTIAVDDPALADRLTALLSDVAGLRLARPGEAADIAVVSARAADPPNEPAAALTPREIEALGHLAAGASNKTIGRRLGISVHTVKFHVGSLLDKLEATGRTDAVAHAARLDVVQF
jgi:DNA-binding CsgD family transcriptional regulator